MRAVILSALCLASLLTGCIPSRVIRSETRPINATDLAVKHVFKAPKNKAGAQLSRFQDPQLQQLISVALADAPNTGSAKARVMRAAQIAKGTYSRLMPSAGLNGFADSEQFDFNGALPPPLGELPLNKVNLAGIGFNFHYELDFWGKNRENLASKINEAFAAEMDLAETRLILSSAVAITYFQLQNSIVQQSFARENVRILKELEGIVVDRAKQGIFSDIPVKTSISNTQKARLICEDYRRSELQSRHKLAVLLGKNPFNTRIEAAPFSYHSKQMDLPRILSVNVLAKRPDIASALAMTEAAAHQINVARAAFFPDINLRAALTSQTFYFARFLNLSFQDAGAGAALSLPIFDAGARKANWGVRNAEFEFAVNQYNQSVLNALQEVTDHMAALHTLEQQILDQDKSLGSTRAQYSLFHQSYRAGIIDYVKVLEIKQLLVEQESALIDLQSHRKQVFVALLAALGSELQL